MIAVGVLGTIFQSPAALPPSITTSPAPITVSLGSSATFVVTADAFLPLTYQWHKDGAPISGANAATYTIPSVTASDAAAYTVTVANAYGGTTSQPAVLTVRPFSWLTNVAVRTTLTSHQLLTIGFTVRDGTAPFLLRAVGPGLRALGAHDAMADPRMELFSASSSLSSTNDNWSGNTTVATAITQVGAFPLPDPLSLDAAMVRPASGTNTVQVSGPVGGTVLVEAYATGSSSLTRLSNLSALAPVGTGSDVLIAGFTLSGSGTRTLLIRAVGPSLTPLGVPTILADPKLELFDAQQTKLAENDTYAPTLATTFSAVGAFALLPDAKDAALLTALPPGSYTAVVSGVANTTGTALIEVYEVP